MKTTKQTWRDAKQLFRLCLVDGLLNEDRVRQAVQRVSQAEGRNRLALLSGFQRLVRLDCDRRTATVESAAPLSSEFQDNVQAGLARMYGPGLNTSFAISPALIGGMRIRVADDIYDASVRAKLAALEERLDGRGA